MKYETHYCGNFVFGSELSIFLFVIDKLIINIRTTKFDFLFQLIYQLKTYYFLFCKCLKAQNRLTMAFRIDEK